MTDVLIGLLLVSVLAAALGVAVARQRRAADVFGDTRDAVRLAERTLIELRAGRAATSEGVVVRRLTDAATAEHEWVEVTATVRGSSESLIGRVPRAEVKP